LGIVITTITSVAKTSEIATTTMHVFADAIPYFVTFIYAVYFVLSRFVEATKSFFSVLGRFYIKLKQPLEKSSLMHKLNLFRLWIPDFR